MKHSRFVVLDGVRGFAALVVMIFHFSGNHVFAHGYLAVDLFFCLSGFVLMHVYGKRGMQAGAFMVVRLIRLYPMYAVCLLIGALVELDKPGTGFSLLIGGFMLPHLHGDLYPLNGLSWSLVDEILINIVFGFMIARRIAVGWLLPVALAVGAALLISQPQLRHINGGWSSSTWVIGALRTAFSFSLGTVLYRFSGKLPAVNGWWIVCGVLVVLGIPNATHSAIVPPVAIMFALPLAVWAGSSAYVGPRSARLFERLGGISYALYAVQNPIMHLTERFFGVRNVPMFAGAVVSLILAHTLATYIDPPVRRWLTRLNKSTTSPAPTPGNLAPIPSE